MDLIETIRKAWGWRGIDPWRIIGHNAFGNVIVEDVSGRFWRICPEELSAAKIAASEAELAKTRSTPEFSADWEFSALTRAAKEKFGNPGEGRCFCLKIPAVMGGRYDDDNLGIIALVELLNVSGDLAQQIDGLTDGTKVKLVAGSRPIES